MFRKQILVILALLVCVFSAYAADITQNADRVNYWDGKQHTVTVTNSCADAAQVNITIAGSFVYDSGTCTQAGAIITCNIASGSSKYYIVNSSASDSEYSITKFAALTNNSCTVNNVSFIKIKDYEIFHTLVEFGRGRGNYFFDTFAGGQYATTGHTGTGCSYLPNGTMFELNFLHKINNIKQYFGDLSAEAYNATFSCIYSNDSIVRTHLISAIVTNTTGAFVSYMVPTIEGSWDRMGYIGMDFNAGSHLFGQSITINCTDMKYYLPVAGGNVAVDKDSFALQIRNKEPFTATAATVDIIGNGTQEVLITYTIKNNEPYTVNDVIIEIQAPPYAQFIGTRGELWGYAQDQYRVEKTQLVPNQTETIMLFARFDTTNAPNINSIDLTNGVMVKYVTCWELNAYNPNEYTQTLRNVGNGTVDMGTPSDITSVITMILRITNITKIINTTVMDINTTVTQINNIVNVINQTTKDTNIIVKQINTTSNTILTNTNTIITDTNIIMDDTTYIIDLLNCNGTNDSPICDKIRQINTSVYQLFNLTWLLNYTANNLNITVIENINTSGINISVYIDFINLTNMLREVKSAINCTNMTAQPNTSVCSRLENIENNTLIINSSLNSLWNITAYFNNTVFGNYTFIDILERISNVSADTTVIKDALEELRSFDEEIVFLITDSFGLQQTAYADFNKGDIVSAADNLAESNTKLTRTIDLMLQEQQKLSPQQAAAQNPKKSTNSTLLTLILALMAVVMLYVASKKNTPPKKEEGNKGVVKILLLCLLATLLTISSANTANATGFGPLGTIVQEAEHLNFGNQPTNETINIYYNCTGVRTFNITFLPGLTVTNTSPCSLINSTLVSCTFDGSSPPNKGSYTVSITPSAFSDHSILQFPTSLSNTTDCSYNSISQIKMPDDEIFQTLVEYGRGRGNYFYSTVGGTAGSGHTEQGCPYVPNETMFELNFLHKIFNIKQYYNDANMVAVNATFTCTYPNRTIVRSHLGKTIAQSASGTTITYNIDEVSGDWERMGYIGIQFDPSEQYVGQNLTITCTNISYYLQEQSGSIAVFESGTTFKLEVRNPRPFTVTSATASTIGNGTQEVIVRYNITNTELYSLDSVIIEIQAPQYGQFIGTRGELWGYAQDQYRIEKMSMAPGQSEIIDLVVRFDTTNAPNINSIALSSGVLLKYVTCWDINAYNPAETSQGVYNTGNGTVDMSIPSKVIDVRERLIEIFNTLTIINSTTININNTVNTINSVVNVINTTTIDTNIIVKQINNTVNLILTNTNTIITNTNIIKSDTATIKDMLNCNGTVDTPICNELDIINSTITNITSIIVNINQTLNNITINITINLEGQNISINVTPDLTNITIIIQDIMSELNCSNVTGMPESDVCKRLIRIQNNTDTINQTINDINDLILYFNATTFGNVTLEDIYKALDNTTIDFTDILTIIKNMKEFDEELVFLVTDSFGLQQQAKAEVDKGNIGEAAAKLKEANARLSEAAVRLVKMQSGEQTAGAETTAAAEGKDNSILALLLVIVCLAVFVFLVARPPRGQKQMVEQIKDAEKDDLEPPKPPR